MDGFTYRGIHCSKFGQGYIPGEKERMPDTPSFKQIEETVTGHAGGYKFGWTVEIREMTLACYMEEVTQTTLEKMLQWVHMESSGRLIFDDRPFVYYDVCPTKKPDGKIYPTSNSFARNGERLYSGTINLYFTAHDPYGKMFYNAQDGIDLDGASKGCGIIEIEKMPPALSAAAGSYLVYNPGTEKAFATIRAAGSAPNGMTITNRTTGDICTLLALPSAPDSLIVNGEEGSVKLASDPDGFAFDYHDEGYITLAPCVPYDRDALAVYTEGSNVVNIYNIDLTEEYVGRYIYLNGSWMRIIYIQGESEVIVNAMLSASGNEMTMIAVMNEIDVEGDGLELTLLEMDYVARTR